MLATERGATLFAASGEMDVVIETRSLDQQTQRKRWRRALSVIIGIALGGLLLMGAVLLPLVFREATYLAEKLRYTSICVRCGEQRSSVFYLVLGTEVVRSEKVLPMSAKTLFPAGAHPGCDHDSVLIGKTTFGLSKSFEVNNTAAGTPSGWDFAGMDLTKTLFQLKEMRTGAALGHMQALMLARERGERVGTGLLTNEI